MSSSAKSSAVMFSCRGMVSVPVPNVTITNAQTGTIAAGASTGAIILIVIVAAVLCIAAVVFGRYRKKRAFNRSRQLSVNVGRDNVVGNPGLETRDRTINLKEIDALTFIPPYTQSTLPPPYSQIQGFPQVYPPYPFPNVAQPMPNISQASTIPTTATTTRPYENMAHSTAANEIPPTTSTEEMYDLVNQPQVSSTDLTYEDISTVRERVL